MRARRPAATIAPSVRAIRAIRAALAALATVATLATVAALAALASFSACYSPNLGPPGTSPFRCADGACPSGYRCMQELCIRAGDPDPPWLVGVSSDGRAAPLPVWDGARFGVFWQQNSTGLDQAVGLHYTTLHSDTTLIALGGDVAFDAFFHQGAGRHVVAFRRNDDLGNELIVGSLAPGDKGALIHLHRIEPASAFGFSAPSLAAGPGRTALVAYALGAPPQLASDNLFCTRLDLDGGLSSDGCRPSREQTQGAFVTEATLAASAETVFLIWRERAVHLTTIVRGVELPRTDVPALHVPRAVIAGPDLGLVAEVANERGDRAWIVTVGSIIRKDRRRTVPTYGLVPDIVAESGRFVACARDADGELVLHWFSTPDLAPIGEPLKVPRLSRAEITSCRLGAAPGTGTVAVAWQERVIGSLFRSYAAIVPDGR